MDANVRKKVLKRIERIEKELQEIKRMIQEESGEAEPEAETDIRYTETVKTLKLNGEEVTIEGYYVENSGAYNFIQAEGKTGALAINKVWGWQIEVWVKGEYIKAIRATEEELLQAIKTKGQHKVYFGDWWFFIEGEDIVNILIV